MAPTPAELAARTAVPVKADAFNPRATLPYGLTINHIRQGMEELIGFITFINTQLGSRDLARFETMLMPANFSSMVGEFMKANIPKYCPTLVVNRYHNGHPDLLPRGRFPRDECQHGVDGIELKGSRNASGWQGHNAEACWLLLFQYDSNKAADDAPRPFRFVRVVGAQLEATDWTFSGRSETSRRTPTATINRSGVTKLEANWIYNAERSRTP